MTCADMSVLWDNSAEATLSVAMANFHMCAHFDGIEKDVVFSDAGLGRLVDQEVIRTPAVFEESQNLGVVKH